MLAECGVTVQEERVIKSLLDNWDDRRPPLRRSLRLLSGRLEPAQSPGFAVSADSSARTIAASRRRFFDFSGVSSMRSG